jgi:hypothetical protein
MLLLELTRIAPLSFPPRRETRKFKIEKKYASWPLSEAPKLKATMKLARNVNTGLRSPIDE